MLNQSNDVNVQKYSYFLVWPYVYQPNLEHSLPMLGYPNQVILYVWTEIKKNIRK